MSLRESHEKREKKPYTRLEKGLLAFAAACFAAAAIMFLNYWNAFSQMSRVWLGYYAAEVAMAVEPGSDVLRDGDEWSGYESAEGEVRAAMFKELDAALSLLPEGVLDDFQEQGWKIVLTTHDINAEHSGIDFGSDLAGLTSHKKRTVYLKADPAQLAMSALHEMGHYMDSRLGWPSQSPEFKEAFEAEREAYASFYEYGSTNEYEMFASMCRDVLMGVRGGDAAAPRCTALVEEAIQGGHAYDPPSIEGLTER